MSEPAEARRPAAHARMEAAGYLAVITAAAAWGTSGILIKLIVAQTHVSALAMAFWRDLSTFAVLLAGLGLLRPAWLRVPRRDMLRMAALGSIGVGTFHVFWNLGVLVNGPAVATVQQAAMPVFVAIVARLLWGEPLGRNKLMAIGLTFAGTFLISAPGLLQGARFSPQGLLIGLGIPVTYASYNLLGKPIAGRYHPLTILTYGFGFGAATLLPLQLLAPQPVSVPGPAWLLFVALIGVSTILPFSMYTFGLGRLPASVAGILAMAEILFVSLYAFVLLHERLTALQVLGAGLVIAGVACLSWASSSAQDRSGG